MLSFVVQNFYYNRSSLLKTARYTQYIKSTSAYLYFALIKHNIRYLFLRTNDSLRNGYMLYFTSKHLIKPFWRTFKRFPRPYMGLVSNNIEKSLAYYSISSVDALLSNPPKSVISRTLPRTTSQLGMLYTVPVVTAYLAFQKTLYNSLVLYIFHFGLFLNPGARTFFKLTHGFLLLPSTISLYSFCNRFFFKIKNH